MRILLFCGLVSLAINLTPAILAQKSDTTTLAPEDGQVLSLRTLETRPPLAAPETSS